MVISFRGVWMMECGADYACLGLFWMFLYVFFRYKPSCLRVTIVDDLIWFLCRHDDTPLWTDH